MLLRAFGHAFRGLFRALASQRNVRVHLLATVFVAMCGVWCRVSLEDWRWLIAAAALVWVAELLNTAVEFLANAVCPEFNPLVRDAKDAAAGAVLVAAAAAVFIGASVFLPIVARAPKVGPAFSAGGRAGSVLMVEPR